MLYLTSIVMVNIFICNQLNKLNIFNVKKVLSLCNYCKVFEMPHLVKVSYLRLTLR